MHNTVKIGNDLFYVGASDRRIALFESAFPVPRGVSYNSYLLTDEKTVLFDTVDRSVSTQFFENVRFALGGRKLDYLVVQHMEPDHSATFSALLSAYPEATVVATKKTASMLSHYFSYPEEKVLAVGEGDTLSVGKRTLRFVLAPMVHWPEVMFTYIPEEEILFTADAFGTFGALGGGVFADERFEAEFLPDARRYYFNIVGKYGVQVQNVLKKAAGLKISLVCPLHGPVWRENFGWFLQKYDLWSRYVPEERGVAVFYASVYGHTQNAAEIVATALAGEGVPVKVYDVSVTDVSELLSEAFRYSHLVFASTTYNNGIFVNMDNFLRDLAAHGLRGRKYALIENGSWSPQAGTLMRGILGSMKDMTELGEGVTILSAADGAAREKLLSLAEEIAADFRG